MNAFSLGLRRSIIAVLLLQPFEGGEPGGGGGQPHRREGETDRRGRGGGKFYGGNPRSANRTYEQVGESAADSAKSQSLTHRIC